MAAMMPGVIDLNCDLGEGMADDAALLGIITSANIACGGHAGDDASMRAAVRGCLAHGVAIGAHPSYPDRANFGRIEMAMAPRDLEQSIAVQVAALAAITPLTHIKPHGALYHAAMRRPEITECIANVARRISPAPALVGLAGSPSLDLWRRLGFAVMAEAFADRRYEPDGTLRARSRPDALITDPAEAAAQAVRLVRAGGVDTICVHSDTPGALEIARAVRRATG